MPERVNVKKYFIGSLFVCCLGCGIKGPPLAPLDEDVIRRQKSESVTVNTAPAPLASSSDSTQLKPSTVNPANSKKAK